MALSAFSVFTAFSQLTPVSHDAIQSSKAAERQKMLEIGQQLYKKSAPCGYDEIKTALYAHPEIKAAAEAQEKALQKRIRKIESEMANGAYKADVYTIPVVFHVLHLGEAEGEGNNIPKEQIESAIEGLNRDFRRTAADGGIAQGGGVDAEIEFCLASVDPTGSPHSGINRINANGVANYQGIGIDEDVNGETLKNLSKWPTEDYVNVWVVREINNQGDFGNWSGGTVGYAYPVSGSANNNPNVNPSFNGEDGIVVANFGLGNDPYNLSDWDIYFNLNRTMTHEMGHHLNLQHTFEGNSCSEGDCSTDGDFVCDTPPTTQQTNCNTPACGGDQQVENYMDYTGGSCQNMFSQGQITRMRAVLEGFSRSSLTVSTGCSPDVMKGDFEANATTVAVGQTIQFTDLSTSGTAANSWSWNFGDGNTSTTQNPQHSYSSTGLKTVSLTVGNGIHSDDVVKTNYINVVSGASGNCDTLTNLSGDEKSNVTGYTFTSGGYIPGHAEGIAGYAEQFVVQPGYQLTAIEVGVIYADFANSASSIDFVIYEDNGGYPGNPIKTIPYFIEDLEAGFFNVVTLDTPFDISGVFYVGMEYPGTIAGDTVLLTCVPSRGAGGLNTAYAKQDGGGWLTFTDYFTINSSLGMELYISKVSPEADFTGLPASVCQGEEVELDASSSVASSTYSWSFSGGSPSTSSSVIPTVTFNSTGTKTVSLTVSNGCGLTDEISETIKVDPKPSASTFSSASICGGSTGMVDMSSIVGGSSWDVVWEDNSTGNIRENLPAGTYTATVTNEFGCSSEATAVVEEEIPPIEVDVVNSTCGLSNGGATLTPTEGSGYTYNWVGTSNSTNEIDGVSADTYVVEVGLASCEESIDVVVENDGEAPTPLAVADKTYIDLRIESGEVNFNCDADCPTGADYAWDFGDGATGTGSSTAHTYIDQGLFTAELTVVTTEGCEGRGKVEIEVDHTLSVSEKGLSKLQVIPNPNQGDFELKGEQLLGADLEIIDITGKVVFTQTALTSKQLKIGHLTSGVYMAKLISDTGTRVLKVQVQ